MLDRRRETMLALRSEAIKIFILFSFVRPSFSWDQQQQQFMNQQQAPQVKISSQPFLVSNAQHLSQIVWTVVGKTAFAPIYCISESPVSQLRFVCGDCEQKNITGISALLNSAQDQSHTAGFPTIALPNDVEANPSWNGATIFCQAHINGGTVDSAPSTIIVKYLRQPRVVDSFGQGPVQIQNQGLRFYVECIRNTDVSCQQTSRRKTLRCAVDANPPANTFRWLKNGVSISGNGPEITIGAEMITQSIQCSANNGLYGEEQFTSAAVYIEAYTAARVFGDNFIQIQTSTMGRTEMNQRIELTCQVEGNPRPAVFWKLRKSNGQIVDAQCPQGMNGQYKEMTGSTPPQQLSTIRLLSVCELHISNYSYSGQYWCAACSYVSQGLPECSPGLDAPGERACSLQVQGPPMQAEVEPSVELSSDQTTAHVFVHFCAEPAPRPPREVVFSIDGNEIQVNQDWQNFHFEGFGVNNTVQSCHFARLRISPIHDSDQSRQISLRLQNQFGSKIITVSLADLLGVGSSEIGGMPTWLAVILALVVVGIIVSIVITVCIRMNLFCFDQMKDNQTNYSSDKLKSSINDGYAEDGVHHGLYNGNGMNGGGQQVYISREAVV